MNITYISQVFPPDPGASLRALEQARALARLGHHVTVITTMAYYPMGKVHPDYRGRFFVRERIDDVDIVRVWSVPADNTGLVRRVLSQVSFAVASFFAGLRGPRPDLVVASTHIFAIELTTIALARLRRARSLIEFRDLIPECLELLGVSPRSLQARALRRYFDFCFARADFVAVPGETMMPHLRRRGVEEARLLLLPHAADAHRFADLAPDAALVARYRLQDKFVVAYAGSFSPCYDVPTMVRAARRIAGVRDDVVFLLVGNGQDMPVLRDILERAPNPNVILTGHVPPDDVPRYLSVADACIASRVGVVTPDFYNGYITTKICEYMMAGKPILALEKVPVLAAFLQEIDAGEAVAGGDTEALAEAVLRLREDRERCLRYGRHARRHALEHMERMRVVAEFDRELCRRMGGDVVRRSPSSAGVAG